MKNNGESLEASAGYGALGVFRNGNGPTVLIRTEMDGLPLPRTNGFPCRLDSRREDLDRCGKQLMHGLRHDVHMTQLGRHGPRI